MSAVILDGKGFAKNIEAEVQQAIQEHVRRKHMPPGLAVILVGDDPASALYVSNKQKVCQRVGIQSWLYSLKANVPDAELLALIAELNHKKNVHGVLLQLPLPAVFNRQAILEKIDPKKDVDGLHPYNLGRLVSKNPTFSPCTPAGIMHLLKVTGLPLEGKHAVVVGASPLVGRPLALELLLVGCTVTICHSRTEDLAEEVARGDIVIAAVGQPHLVKGEWIKKGAVVIDVGTNRSNDGRWLGDVEFDLAKEHASFITPVPGGVGPMTVAMLLKNTLTAWLSS